MAREHPWWPFYGRDFRADTKRAEFNLEQVGAYAIILDELWDGGWLPDDDKEIAKILAPYGVSRTIWVNRLKPKIAPMLMAHPFKEGALSQKRMAAELYKVRRRWGFKLVNGSFVQRDPKDKATAVDEPARKHPRRKAEAGPVREESPAAAVTETPEISEKIPENFPENDNPNPQKTAGFSPPIQTQTQSDPPISLTGDAPPKAQRAAPKRRMPEGWEPSASAKAFARDAGFDPADLLGHFKDHHAAKGNTFADWDAAFRTWVRNQKNGFGPRPQQRQPGLFPIVGVISNPNAPLPSKQIDQGDWYGIKAFCAELVSAGAAKPDKDGHTLYEGRWMDVLATEIAKAARLKATWRMDWSQLRHWVDAGIRGTDMAEAIRRIASLPGYQPSEMLRRFDTVVRRKAA